MTNPSLLRIVWESFLKVALPVLAVCGFALGYLKFAGVSPDVSIPLYIVAGILSFGVLVIRTLAEAVYRTRQAARPFLPAILTVRSEAGQLSGVMCLLAPSALFSVGMAVSFYWLDETGFEVQVGIGQITTVQEDGNIQAALVSPVGAYEHIVRRMANNDRTVIDKIRIRPYVAFQAVLGSG